MLLPNNRVYILRFHDLKAFYHQYQSQFILTPNGYTTTPASFQEDLHQVIMYFNKEINDYQLQSYCQCTPYDNHDYGNRELLLYQLHSNLEQQVRSMISLGRIIDDEIYVLLERQVLYLLDRRRQIYVPDYTRTLVYSQRTHDQQRDSESIYPDDVGL